MSVLRAGRLLVLAVLVCPAAAGCFVLRFEEPIEVARCRRVDPPESVRIDEAVELQAAPRAHAGRSGVEPAAFHAQESQEDASQVRRAGHSVVDTATGGEVCVLTLGRLVQQALAQNPDLCAAAERVTIADATLDRARAEFFPRLGISERYGVSDIPQTAFSFQLNQAALDLSSGFSLPGTTDDFQTQLLFEQSLYTGGRRTAESFAAEAKRNAALFELSTLHNELVFRLAESYYRLIQAHNLLNVRTESVRRVEEHLRIVRTRYEAGEVVKSDVLSVQVRLAEVREALLRSRNELQLAWAVLENIVGARVPERLLPAVVPAAPLPDGLDDMAAVFAKALSTRPEIGRVSHLQLAAAHEVDAARASDRPTLGLVADYDVYTGDLQNGNDAFFAGIAGGLNLFDGGRTRSEVRRALAQLRKQNAEQRRLTLDIELDVRRAFLQLANAQQGVELSTEAVGHARESLREIEGQYRARMTTVTQLIDAQVALSEAQIRHANALANVAIARMAVARAVGCLPELLSP